MQFLTPGLLMSTNSVKVLFGQRTKKSLGQGPPQELEESVSSGLYLLLKIIVLFAIFLKYEYDCNVDWQKSGMQGGGLGWPIKCLGTNNVISRPVTDGKIIAGERDDIQTQKLQLFEGIGLGVDSINFHIQGAFLRWNQNGKLMGLLEVIKIGQALI